MVKSYLFIFFSIILCSKNYNYQIKFLGVPVANCLIEYSDTLISNQGYKHLNYEVKTNSFINNFFKIDNQYSILIDSINFNTISYKKKTYQPEIINNIETTLKGDSLSYNNSDVKISIEDKNIFTVLYLFEKNNFNELQKINNIEREGKYYRYQFKKEKINTYRLLFDELNQNNEGIMKHTDIFLWGLFLDDSYNQIVMGANKPYIKECNFKKGFIRITAKFIE